MKHPKYLLAFLSLCFSLVATAQSVTIKVDTVYGCEPATVKFSYSTTLPSVTSVLWDFGNGTTSTLDSPTVNYDLAGGYTIKLNLNNTDSTNISITLTSCLVVPNIFTPNGDANNEDFIVNYNENNILSFKVFTRSGVMILNMQAKKLIWDGKLESGDKVSPGIYYYIIEIKDSSPPITKKGFFYVFY